jgi:hypothetical protein
MRKISFVLVIALWAIVGLRPVCGETLSAPPSRWLYAQTDPLATPVPAGPVPGSAFLSLAVPGTDAVEPTSEPLTAPAKEGEPAAGEKSETDDQSQNADKEQPGPKPWRIPQPAFLSAHGITLGGWVDQGFTVNNWRSPDGFNGVVGFPDRNHEYLLDQLNLYLKRDVDTTKHDWDWGGRVDVMFGTDARFLQALGLETNWGQTGLYELALPQFYGEVAHEDLTYRIGHFYTPLGYEVCAAPENFFYTHCYTTLYGEPFTHTGMTWTYKFCDQFSGMAGLTSGNDRFVFSDEGERASFLGGGAWTSSDKKVSLAFYVTGAANEIVANPFEVAPSDQTNGFIYSLVARFTPDDKWTYIFQHDYGQTTSNLTASWYGINQYLLYKVSDQWSLGTRIEWFRDNNGVRVTGLDPANAVAGQSFAGDFYELTFGANWRPGANWLLRPEVRYDWTNVSNPNGLQPFDAGRKPDQFLFGVDVIFLF